MLYKGVSDLLMETGDLPFDDIIIIISLGPFNSPSGRRRSMSTERPVAVQ